MKTPAIARQLLGIGPNLEPMELIFQDIPLGKEAPGSTEALIRAVTARNAPAAKKHLSLGADPEAPAIMSFQTDTPQHKGLRTYLQTLDAFGVAALRGADSEMARVLVEAALARRPKTRRPAESLKEMRDGKKHIEKYLSFIYELPTSKRYFFGLMTEERQQATSRAFIEAIPPEMGLPWESWPRRIAFARSWPWAFGALARRRSRFVLNSPTRPCRFAWRIAT